MVEPGLKKKDQLSAFLAEELLYDHLHGELPENRKLALEQFLNSNPGLRSKFEYLKRSRQELKGLEQLKVPEEWLSDLLLPHPSLAQQLVSFEKKMAPKFWRYFPYVVVSLAVVLGIGVGKPWRWLQFKDVEVAQVSLVDDPYLKDESHFHPPLPAPKLETPSAQPSAPPAVVAKNADSKPATPQAAPAQPPVTAPPKKTVGILYRSSLEVSDLSAATAQTVQKILALGGRKAGQVELGWERDEDERYFHFSLPESNKEALVKFLSAFGPVRISSQDHPLVMPEGKIRIILIVKGKNRPQSSSGEEDSAADKESESSGDEDEKAQ